MTARVLVVSHEATRTGAPRMAVEVLRALEPLDVERVAVLRWSGPLDPDFAAAADRVVFEPLRRTRALARRFRRTRRLAVRLEAIGAVLAIRRWQPTLVWANTVKSASWVRPTVRAGVPVVLHVHELEPLVSQVLGRYDLDGVYHDVYLVACSEAVRSNLERLTGVPRDRIAVLPSLVDADRVRRLAGEGRGSAGDEPPVVAACGTANHRKGVDLWLRVARAVLDAEPGLDVRFVWIGEKFEPGIDDLVSELELGQHVTFTGEVDNPYPHIAGCDVFTLTSREDPFPLVVLEAMALARPVVAFDVGGVGEQLGDAGVLVPAEAIGALATELAALLGDEGARVRLAEAAETRVCDHLGMERFHRRAIDIATHSTAELVMP